MAGLLVSTPTKRRTFHDLTVVDVEKLTSQAVAITFAVPDELAKDFLDFDAGQHLTVRATIGDEDVRQSYSLCMSPQRARQTGTVRVATARVPGGRMSNHLNDHVATGQVLAVMPPLGSFTVPLEATSARHHVFFAAGSGITPVLAHIEAILGGEPDSRVTLFFGNRSTATIMFLEELEDLKDVYTSRFNLVHVLSREDRDAELFSGRLDGDRIPKLLAALAPVETVDEFYLCGPFGMVETAKSVLADAGVGPERIHHEIFHVPTEGEPARKVVVDTSRPPEAVVTLTLDGRTTKVEMPTRDENILAAALRVRSDAPYSCTDGVCGTCRCKVVEGEVTMDRNLALEPDEVERGFVLACQSHPVTDEVVIDFDV